VIMTALDRARPAEKTSGLSMVALDSISRASLLVNPRHIFNKPNRRRGNSDRVRDGVDGTGKRPHRADQRCAALYAGMGDVFKIVRFGAVWVACGRDGGNLHPVAAMRAGEEESR
jgi:hypothetical protein